MSKTLMPLSFSRLNTFETCPAKFDYLYVTKNVKDQDNEFTIYGTRVHDALERYGRAKVKSDAAAQAIGALDDATPDITKHYPIVDRIASLGGTQLFEQQMAIDGDKRPCDWFGPSVWIRGIADVLVVNGDRAWCLDWKTGKPKSDPTQLQLFAALVFAHYPAVNEVRTSFIWLNHDDATNATYSRAMESNLWLALGPRFERVQHTVDLGVFPARPSGLCRYCPAKHVCSSART
jgi:CRISPR/Cas system-associated exonuclease Cas4 (RecB family)